MNAVSFITEKKQPVSSDWLLGLTVGGYTTLCVACYYFGAGAWISSYPEAGIDDPSPGQLQALLLLIPGLFIGLLDYIQIHSEAVFKRKGNERITTVSVWLNACAILGFFALIALNSMTGVLARFLQRFIFLGAALFFCAGIVIGVLHVLWIVVDTKMKRKPPAPLVDM